MPNMTIGFIPRDRFCRSPESMSSILEHTRGSFQLIVVDPGTPDRFREPLMQSIEGHPDLDVVAAPPSATSNAARNMVLDRAEGEFICLIENDCIVQQDWLDRLLHACEKHPADVAVPLLLEPHGRTDKVHFDDRLGSIRRRPDGRVEIVPRETPLETDRDAIRRAVDFVEMHCILFRRGVFDRIGRFDASQHGARSEVDLSLALWSARVPTVLEPSSRVTFSAPPPVYPEERDYYLRYWDLDGTEADHRIIEERWNLVECPSAMGFVKGRRKIVTEPDPDRQVRHYLDLLDAVAAAAADLDAVVPRGDSVVLVDEAQWVVDDVAPGRVTYPFIQRHGQYWGAPADDEEAIQELEHLRRTGVNYVVFGWPAFWWLDHYARFAAYLQTRFTCVLRNDRLVVFDLREVNGEARQGGRGRRVASPNLVGG